MKRECDCAGDCGARPEVELNRREFLAVLSAGTAAVMLDSATLAQPGASDLAEWKRKLLEPGEPRVYRSGTHTDARMHLGGIGTGNFEIGADGRLTTWQLFNTLRDGQVPFYFAVRAGGVARLLQTAGGPDWPRVPHIEMIGEYPFAQLRFLDPALPVKLEVTAFSPFEPINTRLSSMPLAAFVFRLSNPTETPQAVALAAFLQNPVGYDASEEPTGRAHAVPGVGESERLRTNAHPKYGGNVNEPLRLGDAVGLLLRAQAGREPSLDKPVAIFATENLRLLRSPPNDRPPTLLVDWLQHLPEAEVLTNPGQTLIWIEEAPLELSESSLRKARDAVRAGATLVLSGKTQPLLDSFGGWSGGRPVAEVTTRPDIVFEDFEGDYANWTVEGTAFGAAPTQRALRDQPPVRGFAGRAFANSFHGSDSAHGRLVSREFMVERNFIRFLIGGGNSGNLQVRLIVNGQTVRATTSPTEDGQMRRTTWDVREFVGRKARIEIVDQKRGDFGHITVDQIEFTDLPCDRTVMELLEELLPGRFKSATPARNATPPNTLHLDGLALLPGAEEVLTADGRRLLTRDLGKGRVILVCGPLLEPERAGAIEARQHAYAFLCGLVGARYAGPHGALATAPGFGELVLTALRGDVTLETHFEDWNKVWRAFAEQGRFAPPAKATPNAPTPPGRTTNGAVATSLTLQPDEAVEVPFLLTWRYPNKYNDTKNNPEGVWIGCHYATLWPSASAVAREAAARFADLYHQTEAFRRAMYESTLPWWLVDCLTANAAIIRHIGVVFRIANGDVYGWEGSNGCCPPTCTHVWGYAQTMARLFPELEREMRRIDFKHQQREDGGVNNRTAVPSPPYPTGERPFADGHASSILKAYREALNSPDNRFFTEYWPHVRRATEYLIARDAECHQGEPAGYLEDAQWNTYDQALHGVTTFISGYYLAALRAAEEWARRVGEQQDADRFHEVFARGRNRLVELCWNGEYFEQHLPDYKRRPGEIGPGCMSDQLIGQWWAHQLGLGYILPENLVQSALRAIFKYNWKADLTDWPHSPRAFAGAGDKGLVVCTWPRGGRPRNVMLYSDEVWTGVEYQVAAHMIYEGMIEEGLAIAKGARDRYNGVTRSPIPRNPWSEIECGGHYVRAMASWSLLTALTGFSFDGPLGQVGFAPRVHPQRFKTFFAAVEGWGTLYQEIHAHRQQITLEMLSGALSLCTLRIAPDPGANAQKVSASVNGRPIDAILDISPPGAVRLSRALRLEKGMRLEVTLT
jgi:uncharacterized protein (DUF608 family)